MNALANSQYGELQKRVRLTPATCPVPAKPPWPGPVTEAPTSTAGSYPEGIAPGPDSALWFTEHRGKTLVRSPARGPGLSFRIDGGEG